MEIIVNNNDAGQRLDKFLKKYLKNAPPALIYKYIRKKNVKVNGRRASIDYMLREGDRLSLYVAGDLRREPRRAEAGEAAPVYEDKNILVVLKPAGLSCHPNRLQKTDTLIDRILAYLIGKGHFSPEAEHSFSPAICTRLDFNTGGLVLAAKNAAALRILNERIRLREIRRFYLFLTEKTPDPPAGVIEKKLLKDRRQNKSAVDERGSAAATHYRVLEGYGGGALCEAEIISGRSHQIRAHMSSIGCPILGDKKYGGRGAGQALYCHRLLFDFKGDAGPLQYLKGREVEFDAKKLLTQGKK